MNGKSLIIFGTGQQSDIISFYLKKLSIKIFAYCVDDKFYKKSKFKNKQIITTKELLKKYNPKNYNLHIAISYKKLNQIRDEKYKFFKKKGYSFANVIYNTNIKKGDVKLGENIVILDSYIQPFTKIGNNTFVWSGSTLGHHCTIGNSCWISSGSTIGGNCKIRDYSFLGLNSTIGHFVNVGKKCFVGSAAHVTKNISSKSVVIQNDSKKISYDPEKFLEINNFR
tara:strand:- start:12770 stop:13444 length:675 start_codon:yes stop_codon:yes gene_type:complete